MRESATPIYDAMCQAIDACRGRMPDEGISDPEQALTACLRVARNLDAECQVANVRLRAERGYSRTLKAIAARRAS